MGIFGGFKADFTSRLRKKKKDDGVVCLKYLVHSEFDDVKNTPPHAERATKRNRPIIKSLYAENNRETQTNLQRTQSLNQIDSNGSITKDTGSFQRKYNHEYEYPIQINDVNSTDSRMIEKPRQHLPSNNSGDTATNYLYEPSSSDFTLNQHNIYDDYEEVTPQDEYKTFETDCKNHPSAALLTQRCLEEGEKNVENGEDNFETNIQAVEDNEKNSPKINFKIKDAEEPFHVHFVQADSTRDYSCSEDELSETEEDTSEYTSMGYSSQAASIFFGEDEKPKVTRPRRILLSGNLNGPDEDEC